LNKKAKKLIFTKMFSLATCHLLGGAISV